MQNSTESSGIISGIDLDDLSTSIRPQDDLFRHVNGNWLTRTPIPEDKARYGSFYMLADEAERAVREIIEEAQEAPAGTEERKVGDLYRSFMDTKVIEQRGTEPIKARLDEALAVDSVASFLTTIGRLERGGAHGFVGVFVYNDPGKPERYLPFFDQGGLGLPDENYYREERFADIRTAYQAHLERMFGLVGLDDAAGRAERVFQLEHEIASHHWDNVASRDVEKTYNLMTWAEVVKLAGFDLDAWRDAMGVDPKTFAELVVMQPSFLTGLGTLLTDERIDAWRDWTAWQVIRANASYLTDEIVQANFDFYGKALTGTPQLRERWKRGVAFTEGGMGEAVGRIYVSRHFAEDAKRAMDELVANLIEAYRQSITNLEWMTPATRQRALEKLEKFRPKIGYPVKWRDYSSLIVGDDLVANVAAIAEFDFQRELGKIGKPIDLDEWYMTPQTVNAYYNPSMNEIVFPAAILQAPFFSVEWDAAANYAAIGGVIGHEIGHGFDDQGSKYDGDGLLTDWWTEDDRAAFEARTGSLIEQYNQLAPAQVPDQKVNGALTIGENIGDLGGLGIAWKAYLLHLDGAEPPVMDGMTAAQRFFMAWAGAWRSKGRDEEVIRLMAIDPHSPAEFRCNQIVRNLDEFYDAFEVSEQDQLWLDPAERVRIW